MLKTAEEVQNLSQVINGVDSPNVMSVSSVEPIPTIVDEVRKEDKSSDAVSNPEPEVVVKKEEVKATEEKSEEKVEDKAPLKEAESEQKPEYKDALQKRFDDLTKKRRTAERERDYEREQRLKLEEELKKLKSTVPVKDKPQIEDFDTQEEFTEALAIWAAERKVNEKQDEVAKVEEEKKAKEEIYSADEVLDEAIDKGRTKYDDFDKIVLEPKDLKFTQPLVDVILDSEIAEEIMYYLGKNSDDLEDLSKLNTRRAVREITLIETKLLSVAKKKGGKPEDTTQPEPAPKPSEASEGGLVQAPAKKTTNAPEPITPLRTTGTVEKDPNDMTPKEYRDWRERNK